MALATRAALGALPTISPLRKGGSAGRRAHRNRLAATKRPRVHTLNSHSSVPEPGTGDHLRKTPTKSVVHAMARHAAALSGKPVAWGRYRSSSIAKMRKQKT